MLRGALGAPRSTVWEPLGYRIILVGKVGLQIRTFLLQRQHTMFFYDLHVYMFRLLIG